MTDSPGVVVAGEVAVEQSRRAPSLARLDQTRVVIAIGDPIRERLVLEALAESAADAAFQVVRRCLDADDLLLSVQGGEADAIVVGADLHGLGGHVVRALVQSRLPLVLWGSSSATSESNLLRSAQVTLLAREVEPLELRDALHSAVRDHGRLRRPSAGAVGEREQVERELLIASGMSIPADQSATSSGTIVAVIGPSGGPGISTVAIGLAAALGRTASVSLVDLDLRSPSLSLALDLNPARNVYMVLHEAGSTRDPAVWADLLEGELQPLQTGSRARVLAGVPSAAIGGAVQADGIRSLLQQLAAREQFVVADLGAEADPPSAAGVAQRAALDHADRVLVVTRADVLGLGRTATLLERLRATITAHEERLALVLNRHQPRHHHDPVEVARALRTSVAAVIPDDASGVHAALAAQRPLVAYSLRRRDRAARALTRLASDIQAACPDQALNASGHRERRSIWSLLYLGRRATGRSPA